jgi:hypothetical protein
VGVKEHIKKIYAQKNKSIPMYSVPCYNMEVYIQFISLMQPYGQEHGNPGRMTLGSELTYKVKFPLANQSLGGRSERRHNRARFGFGMDNRILSVANAAHADNAQEELLWMKRPWSGLWSRRPSGQIITADAGQTMA